MGGSESRCCTEKPSEKSSSYERNVNTASPEDSTQVCDPRSPSDEIGRTPIEVPMSKPMGRVLPFCDTKLRQRSIGKENMGTDVQAKRHRSSVEYQDISPYPELTDPRSPVQSGSRTPIKFVNRQQSIEQNIHFEPALNDPRSPSQGIVRTPLVFEDDNKECQQKYTDIQEEYDNAMRTPTRSQESKSSKSDNTAITGSFDETPKKVISSVDPRSPTAGIERTPLPTSEKTKSESVTGGLAARNLHDPRSPTTDLARTPLGVSFGGQRNLRKTVLMTNALMASPLNKAAGDKEKATYIDAAVENPDAGCYSENDDSDDLIPEVLRCNVNILDESCSSSMVASIGSEVDCISLDDTFEDAETYSVGEMMEMREEDEGNEKDALQMLEQVLTHAGDISREEERSDEQKERVIENESSGYGLEESTPEVVSEDNLDEEMESETEEDKTDEISTEMEQNISKPDKRHKNSSGNIEILEPFLGTSASLEESTPEVLNEDKLDKVMESETEEDKTDEICQLVSTEMEQNISEPDKRHANLSEGIEILEPFLETYADSSKPFSLTAESKENLRANGNSVEMNGDKSALNNDVKDGKVPSYVIQTQDYVGEESSVDIDESKQGSQPTTHHNEPGHDNENESTERNPEEAITPMAEEVFPDSEILNKDECNEPWHQEESMAENAKNITSEHVEEKCEKDDGHISDKNEQEPDTLKNNEINNHSETPIAEKIMDSEQNQDANFCQQLNQNVQEQPNPHVICNPNDSCNVDTTKSEDDETFFRDTEKNKKVESKGSKKPVRMLRPPTVVTNRWKAGSEESTRLKKPTAGKNASTSKAMYKFMVAKGSQSNVENDPRNQENIRFQKNANHPRKVDSKLSSTSAIRSPLAILSNENNSPGNTSEDKFSYSPAKTETKGTKLPRYHGTPPAPINRSFSISSTGRTRSTKRSQSMDRSRMSQQRSYSGGKEN